MPVKVILDTDIGSDIDDAVCLAYLLSQPDCDLLGITTVTGEPVRRAMMASALCKVTGSDVPIYPGEADPIEVEQAQKTAPQADVLDKWEHDVDFPIGEAIEFLSTTIRNNPGEVVLLTIGPLTNIGRLFRDHPDVPSLLKGLVMMCGNYVSNEPKMEWNSSGDPDATRIVFSAKPPYSRALGLNVTNRVWMKSEDVREKFSTPLLDPVLDFAEIWFRGSEVITFHDPLAAATIFDDTICSFMGGRVEVAMIEGKAHTLWSPDGDDSPHQVAVDVDVEGYFSHFFATLGVQ
jgi:inosine-uridine nucleoside N-ribohydrolase